MRPKPEPRLLNRPPRIHGARSAINGAACRATLPVRNSVGPRSWVLAGLACSIRLTGPRLRHNQRQPITCALDADTGTTIGREHDDPPARQFDIHGLSRRRASRVSGPKVAASSLCLRPVLLSKRRHDGITGIGSLRGQNPSSRALSDERELRRPWKISESNCHARESGHPVTTGFGAVLQSQARGCWIARSTRAMTRNLKHLFLAVSLV